MVAAGLAESDLQSRSLDAVTTPSHFANQFIEGNAELACYSPSYLAHRVSEMADPRLAAGPV